MMILQKVLQWYKESLSRQMKTKNTKLQSMITWTQSEKFGVSAVESKVISITNVLNVCLEMQLKSIARLVEVTTILQLIVLTKVLFVIILHLFRKR